MEETLDRYRDAELDLAALCEAARKLLSGAGIAADDDRVSAFPDKRTIRYYQSLGLLARPLRYEGRRAIYGYGHLLRVVCIKLLQAQGQSLAQLQRTLPGVSGQQLEAAVREALSLPLASPDAMRRGRSLVTVEVIPGVIVTIDPLQIEQPERTLARISEALTT